MSVLTLEAKLQRTDNSTPWGFRMQGGKDFSSPLTIQNVNPGSLAAKCGLQTGDIILKIGEAETRTLKHKEAQSSILDCGNHLDLLLQRGGNAGYERFNGPEINTNSSWNSQPQTVSSTGPNSQQSYSSTPRPYASQATRPNYEPNLSHQTSNLSLSSQPKETLDFQSAAEKYAEKDEVSDPSQHQSKSFKYLANLMDEGRELNSALKPRVGSSSPKPSATVKPQHEPAHIPAAPPAPAATPIGPGSKPGTVKALVSQRYNNPIGLYSNDNVNTQLEGQSKFLADTDETSGDPTPPAFPPPAPPTNDSEFDEHGRKRYIPSETFRMVQEEVGLVHGEDESGPAHSRSFLLLQQQLESGGGAPPPAPAYKPVSAPPVQQPYRPPAAKPWAPPPAQPHPVSNTSARPFGSSAPPAPTGVGATRGKKGDAAINPAMLPASGRVPVCSGCNLPVRGPFVTALGKCWCPDHFVCANPQCGIKLLDIGFVEEGGQLYCERDYAIHFAPHCDRCGQAVIGECVNALQKSFHPLCFLCAQCNKPIGGTKFHIEDGKYFCEADWAAMFQTMCAGCDFPIEPGDRWVEALGRNYHSECFNCAKCQVNLEGQQFCAKGGKAYCKNHAR